MVQLIAIIQEGGLCAFDRSYWQIQDSLVVLFRQLQSLLDALLDWFLRNLNVKDIGHSFFHLRIII